MAEKKKILIVDDDRDILELIEIILKDRGYELSFAYDGAAAMKTAVEEKPNLIILDVMLPFMDGYSICRKLKCDEQLKNSKVIFLTARALEADKKLANDAGSDAYITKPFNSKELIAKIEELLSA